MTSTSSLQDANTSSLDAFRALDPEAYLSTFTNSNTRPTGRPLHTTRPTTILPSILSRNTHGSSLVKIGNTQVLTGITLLVGHPGPLTPTHGDVDLSINLSPLSSQDYNVAGRLLPIVTEGEMSRSRTTSPRGYVDVHALESLVQRILRTSSLLNPNELCIQVGLSAWRVQITCMVLNHDGNLEDACLLGAVSALLDLKLPAVKIDMKGGGNGVVQIVSPSYDHEEDDMTEETKDANRITKLTIQKGTIPISLTMGIYDNHKILVDMTREEEVVCKGVVTVVVTTTGEIVSLTKCGGLAMSPEDMAACVHLAIGRAKEVEELLLSLDEAS
uniref:Ribosomal RNA-processing protein 43 n=1 Tax=Ditylum brightwellii TaxID=49249 RepID=A0A7S4QFX6_9STRA